MCSSDLSQLDVFFSDPLCCSPHQLQFSEVLVKWRQFFNLLAAHQGKSDMAALEQKLELGQLKVGKVALGNNWKKGVVVETDSECLA